MTAPTIGSLCTGYGGLELALLEVLGGEVLWHSENDPQASKILDHHWPHVPNLGDLTSIDWTTVPQVDWICAGYPCQPESYAGKGLSTDDPRWIWPHIARAVSVLRPRHLLLENVRGHLGRGLRTVLGSLTDLGYDATWGVVRASEAGAPHRRERVFIVATESAGEQVGSGRLTRQGAGGASSDTNDNTAGTRHLSGDATRSWTESTQRDRVAPHPESNGRDEGRSEPARVVRRSDVAERGAVATDPCGPRLGERPADASSEEAGALAGDELADHRGSRPAVEWGPYGPAIERWGVATGRPAPRPTEPGRNGERLSPRFVEWLMGLPAGHVTDVDIPRNAQLKALGNGVVPQQAALALRTLLPLALGSEVAA